MRYAVTNHGVTSCREAAARERLALLRSHDRAAYAQLVAQHKSSRVADLLAQTNDCLRHLSERLRLVSCHAGGGSGSDDGVSSSSGNAVQSGASSEGAAADEAEAWARRMVFDSDVAAPPQGLRAELRAYQMKVCQNEDSCANRIDAAGN